MRSIGIYAAVTTFIIINGIGAQVVTTEPPFATANDSIIVYFDAAEGNEGLLDYAGDDVYAHTGLITEESSEPSDWRYVVTPWPDGSNDAQANRNKNKLTRVDGNLWKLVIGYPREYYVDHTSGQTPPPDEKILKLAFVFRNSDGSKEGKDVGNADIFYELYEPGITAVLSKPNFEVKYGQPERSPMFAEYESSLPVEATAAALGTELDSVKLLLDEQVIASTTEDTLNYDLQTAEFEPGMRELSVVGIGADGLSDTLQAALMILPPPDDQPRPAGIVDGINYEDAQTVTLSLFAPYKQHIFVVGDFNDWQVDEAYMMKRDSINADSVHYWLTLPNNLSPGTEYAFQYLVDGNLRIADPYTEKVLDPWNDQYIDESTYPNLKPYPDGKTDQPVGILQTARVEYEWQTDDYQRPPKEELIIYELLVRDFVHNHDFETLVDTLDYLQNLGVNAIELMPVMEFEGNISWGYNPSFYFAVDKYYGPADDLKRFIDACHSRDMAVILDMVLNHAFGQCPLVRLYWDAQNNRPAADSPWFNQEAKHPFNVGYDFNHESQATKGFVDRVNAYWLSEFKFDGFRFDLSKGFMQSGSFYDYNGSRVALLKRMADRMWAVDSSAYVILEHLGDNTEERELANYGMLLWGNMNTQYSQSAMGWLNDNDLSSDLSWGYYETRSWPKPHLVTYMESHDEQWLMAKNLKYGRSSDGYDIKELPTALNRMKLVAAFFLTLPGPKMMWQFEELGYDYELTEDNRTDPKPIRWNYFQDPQRKKVYKTFAALMKLRKEHEVFTNPEEVNMRVGQGQYDRRINLTHPDMRVTIIGNFGVETMDVTPNFQHPGEWYDFFERDTIFVSNSTDAITLAPGAFHIYTDKAVEFPEAGLITDLPKLSQSQLYTFRLNQNYPNPFNPETFIVYELPSAIDVTLDVYNALGQKIATLADGEQQAGRHRIRWNGKDDAGRQAASGVYFYRLKTDQSISVKKMLLLR